MKAALVALAIAGTAVVVTTLPRPPFPGPVTSAPAATHLRVVSSHPIAPGLGSPERTLPGERVPGCRARAAATARDLLRRAGLLALRKGRRLLSNPPRSQLCARLQELRPATAHPARRAGVRLRGARMGARGGRRALRRERTPDLRAVVVRAERVHHGPGHEDGQAALAEQGARRERPDVPRHAPLPRDRVRLHGGARLAVPPRPEDRPRRRAAHAAERPGAADEER